MRRPTSVKKAKTNNTQLSKNFFQRVAKVCAEEMLYETNMTKRGTEADQKCFQKVIPSFKMVRGYRGKHAESLFRARSSSKTSWNEQWVANTKLYACDESFSAQMSTRNIVARHF